MEWVELDKLFTQYYIGDGNSIIGQSTFNGFMNNFTGQLEKLESGRGYKLYTTNNGWLKWEASDI